MAPIRPNIKNARWRRLVNNPERISELNKIKSTGTWLKVYDAATINGQEIEVHYFLHKESGTFTGSKIKYPGKIGWSRQFNKVKNNVKNAN